MDLKNYKTMDVNILLGIVNMKMRDENWDLDELVKYYDIDKEDLVKVLEKGGFSYFSEARHFA
ncbi:MAG: DUF4250 domain-containing protein [Fusobacteriaceae bacterium]|nr:DUF4250 domain-containing protein [Fusobacteriaceae bacterium]MBN2838537.1 DUF4250 domain-containing protein [Fusobacteriaceae bacterium]